VPPVATLSDIRRCSISTLTDIGERMPVIVTEPLQYIHVIPAHGRNPARVLAPSNPSEVT
jgi:hypothetical protein